MSTAPFVAEIQLFPFNFAPKGWASCEGQILPLSQNTALFSLLGTYYGGDGKSTFALPNLNGAVPIGVGQSSASGVEYYEGETGGTATVTLLESEIPSHRHLPRAAAVRADEMAPSGSAVLATSSGVALYRPAAGQLVPLAPQSLAQQGADAPHNNMQPYLALQYCIALQGIFPPRG